MELMPERCPYSEFPYSQFSDDHIFPQFLGGRRTVRVCKDCNNRFGHTFEGRASKQLMRLQVFISHVGLDLSRTRAIWPAALTIGDETYDLVPGPDGVQYTLNKPTFRRDDEGNILSGKARSVSEANQIAGGLIRSGKAKEVEISADPGEVWKVSSSTVILLSTRTFIVWRPRWPPLSSLPSGTSS
jgi:hypothetical protein